MYKYTVPIGNLMLYHADRKKVVETMREMGVSRIMLCNASYYFEPEKKNIFFDALKDNCEYLKAEGFEVGYWVWTFMDARKNSKFVRMRIPSGEESVQSICPSDPNFRKFAADYICDVAKCGVELIMYDDDFRYGNLQGSVGCVCDNHLAYMSEILGEKVTLETLDGKLFAGGANKYRSAWIESKRHFFELFASDMRAALDKVAPHVRLGFCASYCSWNQDGITPYELSKILAGNTKPFFRLCGAPFWASLNIISDHTLPDVIEFARLQLSFRSEEDQNTEVFSEGDTWPRPRWKCPANYLESFDQALRISGEPDGIMKYTMEYISSENYETGFNKRHLKNLPLYKKMDEMFADKECIGIRVFEYPCTYENTDVPAHITNSRDLEFTALPYASRMLAAANIPISYKATDTVGIVFGENAKYIPLEAAKNGLILDAKAAEILTERGIDVGLKKKGDRFKVIIENFTENNELLNVDGTFAYEMTLNNGAKVESMFITYDCSGMRVSYPAKNMAYDDDLKKIVGSYTYENANGEKFLVFAFDGGAMPDVIYKPYARMNQLKKIIPFLGKTCGLTICTEPYLYTIVKRNGTKVAIALWNFIADPIDEPYITIENKNAKIVSTIGCEATLCDGVIKLSRIEPYGFAAVEYETI